MKASVGKNCICFTTESEFEVAALKQWEGKKATVCVETYSNQGYFTTGYIRINFASCSEKGE